MSQLKEAPSRSQPAQAVTRADIERLMDRYKYNEERRGIVTSENLLPAGLLSRLHASYPEHSGLKEFEPFLFDGPEHYQGLEGFRQVAAILKENGVELDRMADRELFVEVYRFKATKHILNTINWNDPANDPMYQLVIPQPGMMRPEIVAGYLAAAPGAERDKYVEDYIKQTNPHDGHQLLNKPWIEQEDGGIEIVEGSQHKYPQTQLVFDKSTQTCFAFCTYCFRHAQVRGQEDMFIQEDIAQIHEYLRKHKEVTDLLITGGDAGYLPAERLRQYVQPLMEDPGLLHIRTVRIASRMLTFQPENVLTRRYDAYLDLFDEMHENGLQAAWMAHFSTPREVLNPNTIAAIRRLQKHNVVIRAQSPIMNHVSLFMDGDGKVDIQRSARNWIDLGNILGTLLVGFHSMYCARATGEHHYFTAPLADIEKISNLIFRSLSSINRPSRYITMTTSAGKLSLLGEAEVGGQRALALKFNEARNMEWMDKVFLAKYDTKTNRVDRLQPIDTESFFFEEELAGIEKNLERMHRKYVEDEPGQAGTKQAAGAANK